VFSEKQQRNKIEKKKPQNEPPNDCLVSSSFTFQQNFCGEEDKQAANPTARFFVQPPISEYQNTAFFGSPKVARFVPGFPEIPADLCTIPCVS